MEWVLDAMGADRSGIADFLCQYQKIAKNYSENKHERN